MLTRPQKAEEASPFTPGAGFAWLPSPPKVMTQRTFPSSEVFPVGLELWVVPRAEVLPQVGRVRRVALRSETAPARAHLAPAVIHSGDHRRFCWKPSAWRPQAQPSVNTRQHLLRGHGALVGLEFCRHMGLHTRPQGWQLGTLLTHCVWCRGCPDLWHRGPVGAVAPSTACSHCRHSQALLGHWFPLLASDGDFCNIIEPDSLGGGLELKERDFWS